MAVRLRFITVPAVMLAALAGCATPSPLVRLYPSSPDVIWVAGRASVTQQDGGLRLAAAFDHQDGETLGLRVEVENATEGRLDVDPREFTFTTCRGPKMDSCTPTRRVIDPEQVLVTLDAKQSRERADAANSQAMLGTMVILSAVTDVAAVTSGHGNGNVGGNTVATASLMQTDAAARNTGLASISTQQQVWSNEALRRNTLLPGAGVGGRIYLPIDLEAQFVWLHVRAGGRFFSFPFRQVATRLDAYGAESPAPQSGVGTGYGH